MKLDLNKPITTTNGTPVTFVTKYNAAGNIPSYTFLVQCLLEKEQFYIDILPESNVDSVYVNKKTKKQGWINIYPGGYNTIYSTEEDANKAARCAWEKRKACVRVEWTEE